MLRTVWLLLFEVFYFIGTLFSLPRWHSLQKRGDAAGAAAVTRGVVRRWSEATLRVSKACVETQGLENLLPDDAPAVYVGNHQGYFDSVLVLARLGAPKALIAKASVSKIPIVRGWMRRFGCVFVQRDDPRKAAAAFREAAENVAAGNPMILFPEGTRSRDGEMLPFKGGAFRIAQKARVPVVPFCIDGTGLFFERNGNRLNPDATLILHVLPAIDTSAYTRDDWKALPQLCEEQIRAELQRLREGRSPE